MACFRVSVIALLAALPFSQVSAEITLDGTMGPAGPLSGPAFTIADTLGTTQDANLFHSFSVFNIDSTESATFTGPAGLDNVISRVTGGTASSIDGLFRSTVPGADVYFINPAKPSMAARRFSWRWQDRSAPSSTSMASRDFDIVLFLA